MSICKTIKSLTLSIGVPIAVGLGIVTGINFYLHHNVNYEEDGKRIFQKADGIFDYTELEINEDDSIDISRYSFGNTRFYTDEDGDEKVDRIFKASHPFVRGSHSRAFYRDKHLEQYPQIFERADQDFREQMKRFKPYINR